MDDKHQKPRLALDAHVLAEDVKTGVYRVCDELFRRLYASRRFETYLFVRDGYAPKIRTYLSATKMEARGYQNRAAPSADADIFLSPFTVAPVEWLADKNVLHAHIVHDLIAVYRPEYFDAETAKGVASIFASFDERTLIFAVSEHTKRDLLEYRPDLKAEQVTVMPLAAGDRFHPCRDRAERAAVRQRYGIPPGVRYVLSLATLEIRKNLDQVVNAFVQLLVQDPSSDMHLVLAGMSGWKLDKLDQALDAAGGSRDRIILTGFVDDADLSALYSDALCFVYLSRYEGFGLPPLEAMACGTPVICSNASSLPEVVGDAGVVLDADDVDGVVEAIQRIAASASYRDMLASKGLEHAALFSWDRSAGIVLDALAAAYARHAGAFLPQAPVPVSAGPTSEKKGRRYLRRALKGLWWLATPWNMPKRISFMRDRALADARAAEMTLLVEQERARISLRQRGAKVEPPESLDLFDNDAVSRAAGLALSEVLWTPVKPEEVTDRWSAARFLIDSWRSQKGIRAQFPQSLGLAELGLSQGALRHVEEALKAGISDRARQAFLVNETLNAVLPHGLTPAGIRTLFSWFMRGGARGAGLRLEEVWWLFLEAQGNPGRELVLAHSFSRTWQQRHPAGLTVFGSVDFARWIVEEYGVEGRWTDPSSWPKWGAPALQILAGYWASQEWRAKWPNALNEEASARALLAWLTTEESGLSKDVCDWCARLDHGVIAAQLTTAGVNVIGHFCYPSGLRVSAESLVEAAKAVGVQVSLRDLKTDANDDPHHVEFRGMEVHDVTIIHAQPEPFFDVAYERSQVIERNPRTYRIAYWYWEFDSIPASWAEHAQAVDEVWAATEFVARGLRERLDIPVRTLFPGIKLASYEKRGRAYFGLPEAPYTFLFTFHMMSVMERKNPLGLIRAFRDAFGNSDSVRLVLKTSFGHKHPKQFQQLRKAAKGANITLIDQVYSPDEVLSLMDACDAYVSLHRSEGLGLTMAEAMLMGKPVIATRFSGNVDFMDDDNSLLVPYELVKVGKSIPPYDADLEWAEPSVEHAAMLMRRVFEDQDWAREVGARARASAEAHLSIETAGRRMAARVEEIRVLRKAGD